MFKKKKTTGEIVVPLDLHPHPLPHEIRVARLLAEHFSCRVEFVHRSNIKSPDFIFLGKTWELKSPIGRGRNNIQRQFQYAFKQSPNLIIDSSRSKMHADKIFRDVKFEFNHRKSIQNLIYLTKIGKVIVFQK